MQRLLVHDGWVVVLPRKGYLVRSLRFEDVREVFAMRQMIEPALVAEAAKRSTPEQLDTLDRHIDAQVAARDDMEAALNAAAAFHIGIAKLAANERAERTSPTSSTRSAVCTTSCRRWTAASLRTRRSTTTAN